MKIIKHKDQSMTFVPQTALDHSFLIYLHEAVEARTEKIIIDLGSAPYAESQSHAQDAQPLIIGAQP